MLESRAGQSLIVPDFPSPISHYYTNAAEVIIWELFAIAVIVLFSPTQPQDPESPSLKYKPGWKTATGVNQSWEKDRFELFIFTWDLAGRWTPWPGPFPWDTVTHISVHLFFQPPIVTLWWREMTEIDLKWDGSQRSLALFSSTWWGENEKNLVY